MNKHREKERRKGRSCARSKKEQKKESRATRRREKEPRKEVIVPVWYCVRKTCLAISRCDRGKGKEERKRHKDKGERERERDRKEKQTEGKTERGSGDVNKDESRFDEPLFCPRRVGATSSSVHERKKKRKKSLKAVCAKFETTNTGRFRLARDFLRNACCAVKTPLRVKLHLLKRRNKLCERGIAFPARQVGVIVTRSTWNRIKSHDGRIRRVYL